MKIWHKSINTYLLVLPLLLLASCKTGSTFGKKDATTIRLHLECKKEPSGHSIDVPIFREHPTMLTVQGEPILNEGDVTKATVVENMGAFGIKLEFTRHGRFVLETTSVGNKGRRLAVFSLFGSARWLGVVTLDHRIEDGVIVFTPDASREEADRIVRGLNNVANYIKKNPDF